MIRIGLFSKISQVSIKTLRYYDEVGLLKPVEVDRFTGYRYYSFNQLTRLNRILALKDLGFSLEQITSLLEQDMPSTALSGMLRLKQAELQKHLQEEQERLDRIKSRLEQLEQEVIMSDYDVVLKKVEPILVAGVRDTIPDYPQQGHLWERLETALQKDGIIPSGPCFTIYYADEPEIDAEVCEPLGETVSSRAAFRVHELLPIDQAASVVHHGPFATIGQAYNALLQWIESNSYRICGPSREIYLEEPNELYSQNDPNTVTEIQFPVSKA